jgi:hypothetical protein
MCRTGWLGGRWDLIALMNPTALGSSTKFFNAYDLMNAKGIYQLIPYIYSLCGKVWLDDYTIMRPLAMDFPTAPGQAISAINTCSARR